MIACDQLTKQFGPATVLDRVSFQVKPGRICALLGPNGAGKSTTIKILIRQLALTSGTAMVNNISVSDKGTEFLRQIGVVPENLALIEDLTVGEHLTLSGAVYGLSKAVASQRTDQLLRVLGLEHGKHTFLRNCSHGMRKKAALALALLHAPSVVLLDEPFEGVDPVTAEVIRNLLLRMASRGTTILLTSHILSLISRVAEDVIVMNKGSIVWTSDVRGLPGSLEELYFGLIEAPLKEELDWLQPSRS